MHTIFRHKGSYEKPIISLILFFYISICSVFAEPLDSEKFYAEQLNEAKNILAEGGIDFKCDDILLIDQGMAMDRNGYFYNAKTREPICIFNMIPICAVRTKNGGCDCPPPEWKKNRCSEKFKEYRNLQDRKYQDITIK